MFGSQGSKGKRGTQCPKLEGTRTPEYAKGKVKKIWRTNWNQREQ